MGMSASQARLLALTARQSNLEYEGQQINQQRTSLSNQSANYYNSLLLMNVPTPPSTDDYTTVKYEFVISGNNATIGQVLPQDQEGNYLVTYTTTLSSIGVQENTAYKISATANESSVKTGKKIGIITDTQDPQYNEENVMYHPENQYFVLSFREDDANSNTTLINNKTENYAGRLNTVYYDQNGKKVEANEALDADGNLKSNYSSIVPMYFDKYGNQVEKTDAMENGNLKDDYSVLVAKNSYAEQGYSQVYVKLADEASYNDALGVRNEKVYLFEENSIDVTYGNEEIQTLVASNKTEFSSVSSEYAEAFLNAGLDINEYYQYESATGIRFAKKEDISKSANTSGLTIPTYAVASLSTKQTHTLSNVQIEFDNSGRISTMTDAEGKTYTMTTSTITDEDAYEDAYNQYTYDQYVYDQTQNEINANIEILQAQDKNLELRLSQLNTEHSAIQTEMDAVNKVLSKNIETSFKTFNA